MKNLTLEFNPNNVDKEKVIQLGKGAIVMCSPGDQENYVFKVHVSEKQAIVAFSKFGSLGVAFLVEDEDGNRNLPSSSTPEKIYDWIYCNKGDDSITDETCLKAIKKIVKACRELEEINMQSTYEIAMANEDYLKGKNGKILSLAQFKETSHIGTYGRGKSKRFVIMTKYKSESGRYEYLIGVRNLLTKSDALKFARKLLIDRSAKGVEQYWGGSMFIKRNKEGMKIPIAF